jgi:type II secretory pathway predicted ATPase ExeA
MMTHLHDVHREREIRASWMPGARLDGRHPQALNPRQLLLSERYRQAVAGLRQGLARPGAMVIITGDPGSGKTTLLSMVQADIEEPFRLVSAATTDISGVLGDLRGTSIGVPSRPGVLVIDDAHCLSLQQLRYLASLFDNRRLNLPRMVLLGYPALWSKLTSPLLARLRERIDYHAALLPLSYAEAEHYVEVLCELAGGSLALVFSKEALHRLILRGHGNPRQLNAELSAELKRMLRRQGNAAELQPVHGARPEGMALLTGGRTAPRRIAGILLAGSAALGLALVVNAELPSAPNPRLPARSPAGIAHAFASEVETQPPVGPPAPDVGPAGPMAGVPELATTAALPPPLPPAPPPEPTPALPLADVASPPLEAEALPAQAPAPQPVSDGAPSVAPGPPETTVTAAIPPPPAPSPPPEARVVPTPAAALASQAVSDSPLSPALVPPETTVTAGILSSPGPSGVPDSPTATPARTDAAAPPVEAPQSRAPSAAVAALLARGDSLIAIGDIAAARLVFQRAVRADSGLAATAIGQTYDPRFLRRIGAVGIVPDPGAAATWYRKAIALGDARAVALLSGLEAETAQ